MTAPTSEAKRVLVLMSDTGGGHRAAAEAIQHAAQTRYPNELIFELVDVFREYTPFPFKYSPEVYPIWVNYAGPTWKFNFAVTNAPLRSEIVSHLFYLQWRRGIRRMLAEHPADMILSVHALLTRPVMKTLKERPSRPPFMTVVTDLVSTHAFWYTKQTDRCLVPTQSAYDRGLHFGLSPQQLRVTGLPVHPNFVSQLTSKHEARQFLGVDQELPTVLLVSGGDGMGPVFQIAQAINQKRLPCQLLIVAGRNEKLKARLQANEWHQPTTIFGFVDFMPRLMAAADMLVTKAGPATISEACMAGLPIIISGAVPGQEDGNIDHVVQNEVGVYAPSAEQVAKAVELWLYADPDEHQKRRARAKALACPQAVWDIADEVRQMAQQAPVAITQHHPIRSSLRQLLLPPHLQH